MGNINDNKMNNSDSSEDIRNQMEEAAPAETIYKPKQELGYGMMKVKLTQLNMNVYDSAMKYDVKAYFKSVNEVSQDKKLMN